MGLSCRLTLAFRNAATKSYPKPVFGLIDLFLLSLRLSLNYWIIGFILFLNITVYPQCHTLQDQCLTLGSIPTHVNGFNHVCILTSVSDLSLPHIGLLAVAHSINISRLTQNAPMSLSKPSWLSTRSMMFNMFIRFVIILLGTEPLGFSRHFCPSRPRSSPGYHNSCFSPNLAQFTC